MSLDAVEEIGRTLAIELKQSIEPLKQEIDNLRRDLYYLQDKLNEHRNKPPIPGPPGKDGEKGEPGEPGGSGIGLAGALVDKQGNLIVTLTDGSFSNLGSVVGPAGHSISKEEINAIIQTEVLKFPKPKDGKDGADFQVPEFDGERTFTWAAGTDKERKHTFPIPIYRGVYVTDKEYERGDCVTWDGAIWIAKEATKERPGIKSGGWQMSAKRGQDGKDGKSIQGPPGPPGRDGRDFTQMDFDGRKF